MAVLHRDAGLRGGLMICGTASDVGKTQIVAGLCRVLARLGCDVAPFKAQNMSLNSCVTTSGHEIARAQALQAFAARTDADVAMNPVLLKPTSEQTSQVVVLGEPIGEMDARAYDAYKTRLLPVVLDALASLRARHAIVIAEGAGGVAEINLLDRDLTNLRVATEAMLPAIVVGDIDRGGVFAALYGSVALLPDAQRRQVRGFVINKLRGDRELLGNGLCELQRRCGVPTLGVLPWLDGISIDAEDSLALPVSSSAPAVAPDDSTLDVAVVCFPRIANFTDLDPLRMEPDVGVRFVRDVGSLGRPDLVVLPGTKATIADLTWLRAQGLDDAIASCGATILGICGGYQMLGRTIVDHIESRAGTVPGLGLLDATTVFRSDKLTRQCRGSVSGLPVAGYQIHHGRVTGRPPWILLQGEHATETPDGASAPPTATRGPVYGATVHGLFENDAFRARVLAEVAQRRDKPFRPTETPFIDLRERQLDRLADALETHLDMPAILQLIAQA